MNIGQKHLYRTGPAFATIVLVSAISATSAALPIFSGPIYEIASGNGYQTDSLPHGAGNASGEAVAVGNARKYVDGADLGRRAMRWTDTAVSELGSLGTNANGVANTHGQGVSARGTMAGYSTKYVGGSDLGERAVRWESGSLDAIELGHLGANSAGVTHASALAINDAGQSVGFAERYSGDSLRGTRAVRWDADSLTATKLGHLGLSPSGITLSYAYAINGHGAAGGTATVWSGGTDLGQWPVRWDGGSVTATQLDVLQTSSNGFSYGYVGDINDTGTSVGAVQKYVGGSNRGLRAVRWDANTTAIADLGLLGDTSDSAESRAYDINNTGVIIGYAEKFSGGVSRGQRAARWLPGSTIATELEGLGVAANGSAISVALANNDLGITVGYSEKYVGGVNLGQRAVFWGEDAVAHELDAFLPVTSGWVTLERAISLTEVGWIAGSGQFDSDGTGPAAPYLRMYLILVPQAGTYGRGDANFDTLVNFDDLVILAQHYGESNAAQSTNVADFDLNGSVDFADLVTLAQNYGAGVANLSGFGTDFAADWALAQSLVPEPTLGLALFLAGTGLRRRRWSHD